MLNMIDMSVIVEIAKDVLMRIKNQNVQFFASEQLVYIDVNCINDNLIFIDFTNNSAIVKLFKPQESEEWGFWENLNPPKSTYQTIIEYSNPNFVDLVIKQIDTYIQEIYE